MPRPRSTDPLVHLPWRVRRSVLQRFASLAEARRVHPAEQLAQALDVLAQWLPLSDFCGSDSRAPQKSDGHNR
jgi:hypothetical protein